MKIFLQSCLEFAKVGKFRRILNLMKKKSKGFFLVFCYFMLLSQWTVEEFEFYLS
jgi:hypothetical protein